MRSVKSAVVVFAALCVLSLPVAAQQVSRAEHTKVGQPMPAFSVVDTTGARFDMAEHKGKLVLVNFWATWCGPCRAEIPRLEKEIWQTNKSAHFAVIGIAREEPNEKIVKFQEKMGFTYPIASDLNREIFKLVADSGIPRNILVGPDGAILFQSVGYSATEFDKLKQLIATELAKLDTK